MSSFIATALVAAVALVVSTDIGDKSDEERFRDAYEPISQKLDHLQRRVHDALRLAVTKSDKQLSVQLTDLADGLARTSAEMEELEAPAELEELEEVEDLAGATKDLERSLRDIATAADRNDPPAARTATRVVIHQDERLDEVQRLVEEAAAG